MAMVQPPAPRVNAAALPPVRRPAPDDTVVRCRTTDRCLLNAACPRCGGAVYVTPSAASVFAAAVGCPACGRKAVARG